jgi:hypothetical protein
MILNLVSGWDDDPLLTIPDDKSSVYKYFTYKNFKRLICSKSLFFSRISNWRGDLSEGTIPQDIFCEIFESIIRDYNLSDKKKGFIVIMSGIANIIGN